MRKRRPNPMAQPAWDPATAKYAHLSHPEWLDKRVPMGFWLDPHNHRRYLTWLARQKNIRRLDDWYQVVRADFPNGLVEQYSSHLELITSSFPDHDWQEWRFRQVSPGFWHDRSNRLRYARWLEQRLGFRRAEDWYSVTHTQQQFIGNHGATLLALLGNSTVAAVKDIYPDRDWEEWRFVQVPEGFWKAPENRARYLRWLSEQLGIEELDDWYRVTNKQLYRHQGSWIVRRYKSVYRAEQDLYPEHEWMPWRFIHVPSGFWTQRKYRVWYMEWLGRRLGFQKPQDWYRLRFQDILDHYGQTMLRSKYNGSVALAAMDCFPEFDWKPWLFKNAHPSPACWEKWANRLNYLRWLEEELGIRRREDWYQVTRDDLQRCRGRGAWLGYYGSSTLKMARELHPKHTWHKWLFPRTPPSFWDVQANRRRHMRWLGDRLGFRTKDDWYQLRDRHFFRHHGWQLFQKQCRWSVVRALRDFRPHYHWDEAQLIRTKPLD